MDASIAPNGAATPFTTIVNSCCSSLKSQMLCLIVFHKEILESKWFSFLAIFDPGQTSLQTIDSSENQTGVDTNGITVQNISGLASYPSIPLVLIFAPDLGIFQTKVQGVVSGSFELDTALINQNQVEDQQSFDGTLAQGQSIDYLTTVSDTTTPLSTSVSPVNSISLKISNLFPSHGMPVSFTASAVGGSANGQFMFYDGSNLKQEVNASLIDGVYSAFFTNNSLSVGIHSITTVYVDSNLGINVVSAIKTITVRSAIFDDFDGDGKSDIAVYVPSTSTFDVIDSSTGKAFSQQFGPAGLSQPLIGDFDGDGKTDIAVYVPSTSTFDVIDSSTGKAFSQQFGPAGLSQPLIGDFDGDGKTDIAVYVPSTSTFDVIDSSTGKAFSQQFGPAGLSQPLIGDFDGDGKTDIAVYVPSTSTFDVIDSSTGKAFSQQFGPAGLSQPLIGDFDGDGKTDIAVYVPSTSTFDVIDSSTGKAFSQQFGPAGLSQPLIGDFDGDGKTDIAVYVPSTSTFDVIDSSTGKAFSQQFGPAGLSQPLIGDFDGDGKTDIASYVPSTSTFDFITSSMGKATTQQIGPAGKAQALNRPNQ